MLARGTTKSLIVASTHPMPSDHDYRLNDGGQRCPQSCQTIRLRSLDITQEVYVRKRARSPIIASLTNKPAMRQRYRTMQRDRYHRDR
jgi:hypothetical protein